MANFMRACLKSIQLLDLFRTTVNNDAVAQSAIMGIIDNYSNFFHDGFALLFIFCTTFPVLSQLSTFHCSHSNSCVSIWYVFCRLPASMWIILIYYLHRAYIARCQVCRYGLYVSSCKMLEKYPVCLKSLENEKVSFVNWNYED